jgi:hypothetical protein
LCGNHENAVFFSRQAVKKLVAENPPARKRTPQNPEKLALDGLRANGYMLPFNATFSKFYSSGDNRYETYLPAQQMPPQKNPRFPGAFPHQKRS